jgi:ABC-type phosphate transport system substrate-binding protein
MNRIDRMNSMKWRRLAGLCGIAMLWLGVSARAQVVVIANPSVKVSEVSRSDLRDIFSGATSSLKGGSPVVPVVLKQGAVHEEMLQLYIGKSDAAFRASWRSLVFSGQAVMPRSMDNDTSMVEYVARTPGAIGYISKGTPHDGVKILTVR